MQTDRRREPAADIKPVPVASLPRTSWSKRKENKIKKKIKYAHVKTVSDISTSFDGSGDAIRGRHASANACRV